VQSGVEQRLLAFADGFAETEDDGFFLRADGEKSRAEKNASHHQQHHDFDNRTAFFAPTAIDAIWTNTRSWGGGDTTRAETLTAMIFAEALSERLQQGSVCDCPKSVMLLMVLAFFSWDFSPSARRKSRHPPFRQTRRRRPEGVAQRRIALVAASID